jgi:hypothetical protein
LRFDIDPSFDKLHYILLQEHLVEDLFHIDGNGIIGPSIWQSVKPDISNNSFLATNGAKVNVDVFTFDG